MSIEGSPEEYGYNPPPMPDKKVEAKKTIEENASEKKSLDSEDKKDHIDGEVSAKSPDESRLDDLLEIQRVKERLGIPTTSEKEEMFDKLSSTIENMSEILNDANCDYYITGGIVAYVVTHKPFDREHSDIDVMVPESQIKTIQKSLNSHGFESWDERYAHRERKDLEGKGGHHNYGARDKESGVRIGFYTFQEAEDGRIVMVDTYGERDRNGELIEKTEETAFPTGIRREDLFDSTKYSFGRSKVGIVTPEYIYLRKKDALRAKDISDAELLRNSGHLDADRLSRLEEQLPNIERHEIVGEQRRKITPIEELSEKVSDTLIDAFKETDISESDGKTMVDILLKNPKVKEAADERPLVKNILERIRKIPLKNRKDFIKSAVVSLQDIELPGL